MSYEKDVAEHFRLGLLRALAEQAGYTCNDALLTSILEGFGLRKSRDYTKSQLRFLETIEAVTIEEAGSVLVATLTQRGHDHVERLIVLDGVKRRKPGS